MRYTPIPLSQIQGGTALITALFIMTLVAAAATLMMLGEQIATNRTKLIIKTEQAYCYQHLVIAWAEDEIKSLQSQPNFLPNWPVVFPEQHFAGALLTGQLLDAQSLFNLNTVTKLEQAQVFKRLMQIVSPTLDSAEAQTIGLNLSAWISSTGNDASYLAALPPYRAAHQFLVHPSELRLINGVSAELYLKLQPFIVALPEPTTINVNSAPPTILKALSEKIDILAVMDYRKSQHRFATLQEFNAIAHMDNTSEDLLGTSSRYYLCQAKVMIDRRNYVLYSLLKASPDSNGKVTVIWESQGGL
jgi:general secretion pathway protein K